MTRRLVNHVPALIDAEFKRREAAGERPSLLALSQEMGMDYTVLARWYKNQVTSFRGDVVLKLAEFFGTNNILEIVDD